MQAIEDTAKKQILVVEDEGLIADDIQRRLERLGYAVPAIARSGEEALSSARSTPYDLVLMDVRLKGPMDGIAVAQRLKDELQMPVVYITAHADQETVERAKLTEPFGYVVKPIGEGSLRSAVQIALYKQEMERKLRASEAWLATTLGSVGDGIIACDTGGEIVFMNPVAERLTGWNGGRARGRLLMDVLGLFEESSVHPAKNPVFDLFPGESRVYDLIAVTGERTPVEIACFENRSPDELLGAILVLRNIRVRRDLETRLVQSQRMEAIAGMAGGLAHDFNNLLMVVMGCAEELGERLSGQELQLAAEIKQSSAIACSITKQLLTLSRRDAVSTEVFNINEMICEVQPLISHSLGKARTLATDLGSPATFVRADRNRLKQVLLNLASNARDAMQKGGELRVSTEAVDISTESMETRRFRAGSYVRLQWPIRDRGWIRQRWLGFSSPSSPPSQPAREPAWGCRSRTALSCKPAGTSRPGAKWDRGRASRFCCPRSAPSKAAWARPLGEIRRPRCCWWKMRTRCAA